MCVYVSTHTQGARYRRDLQRHYVLTLHVGGPRAARRRAITRHPRSRNAILSPRL